MKKSQSKTSKFLIIIGSALLCGIVAFFSISFLKTLAASLPLTGFAWSSNIGWISFSGRSAPPANGLVAHWKFDEGSGGIASDSSGTGLNLYVKSKVNWVTGKFGKAIQIDPSASVGCSDPAVPNVGVSTWDQTSPIPIPPIIRDLPAGSFTLSWWDITPNGNFDMQSRVLLATDFTETNCGWCQIWNMASSTRVRAKSAPDDATQDLHYTIPSRNVWHHYTFIFDRTTNASRIFIDGALQDQKSLIPGGNYGSILWVSVGVYRPDCVDAIPGQTIDDIRIYNRPLNNTEVLALANNGYPYGVFMDSDSGNLSGYAWSSNIGWLSFNKTITGIPPLPAESNVIGSWKMDTGTGVDSSPSAKDLIVQSFPNDPSFFFGCVVGGCLSFDGSNTAFPGGGGNNVTEGDFLAGGAGLGIYDVQPGEAQTITAWIKAPAQTMPSAGQDRWFLWKNGACIGWEIGMRVDANPLLSGRIRATFVTGTSCADQAPPIPPDILSPVGTKFDDDSWHYIALVINRPFGTMQLFVDGVSQGSAAIDNTRPGAGGNFRLGTNWNNSASFNGSMDEVKIYDRALTQSELQEIFSNLYPPNGPIAKMDLTTNKLSGWGRFLSHGGGWDGWLKLRGLATNGSNYGIVRVGQELLNETSTLPGPTKGGAWGGDVVGWVSFCGRAQDNTPYCVNVPGTTAKGISVSLEAVPNFGVKPLNNVDLKATVFNANPDVTNFPITYTFDCTNDDVYESPSSTVNSNSFTAVDFCDYAEAGTYEAKVLVEQGSGTSAATTTATAIVGIQILPPAPKECPPAEPNC